MLSSQIDKSSDIFSFGIVVSFRCLTYGLFPSCQRAEKKYSVSTTPWLKRVIFAVADEERKEGGEDKLAIVLERQLSYFSDLDSPWAQIFTAIAEDFNKEFPRELFASWKDIEREFKNLVGNTTRIDLKRRIAVYDALSHRWFVDVV